MASFAPIKGTRTDIGNTPIVEGQFLVETDQNADNRIYLDKGTGTGQRIVVGGNTDYIWLEPDNSPSSNQNPQGQSSTAVTVTFTNNYIDSSSAIEPFSEPCNSTGVPLSGSTELVPLSYSYIKVNGNVATVTFPSIPSYYNIYLRVTKNS